MHHGLPGSAELSPQIFGLLGPGDLLSLARTSKDFRAFLMSRAEAEKLWIAARERTVGLPPRPTFLSEPAYANLLFSAHCHVRFMHICSKTALTSMTQHCARTNIKTIFWSYSVRYCASCKKYLYVCLSSTIMSSNTGINCLSSMLSNKDLSIEEIRSHHFNRCCVPTVVE